MHYYTATPSIQSRLMTNLLCQLLSNILTRMLENLASNLQHSSNITCTRQEETDAGLGLPAAGPLTYADLDSVRNYERRGHT